MNMTTKVGDHIEFKEIEEGSGTVVELDTHDNLIIVAITEPGSGRATHVHPLAQYHFRHKCMTVVTDEYNSQVVS